MGFFSRLFGKSDSQESDKTAAASSSSYSARPRTISYKSKCRKCSRGIRDFNKDSKEKLDSTRDFSNIFDGNYAEGARGSYGYAVQCRECQKIYCDQCAQLEGKFAHAVLTMPPNAFSIASDDDLGVSLSKVSVKCCRHSDGPNKAFVFLYCYY